MPRRFRHAWAGLSVCFFGWQQIPSIAAQYRRYGVNGLDAALKFTTLKPIDHGWIHAALVGQLSDCDALRLAVFPRDLLDGPRSFAPILNARLNNADDVAGILRIVFQRGQTVSNGQTKLRRKQAADQSIADLSQPRFKLGTGEIEASPFLGFDIQRLVSVGAEQFS